MTSKPVNISLDLSRFQTADDAIARAAEGCPSRYTEVAKRHLFGTTDMSVGSMLFESFVSRLRGLHEGVVREIAASNPHSALPLIRAWVEVVTIGLYVLRHPTYVDFLAHRPSADGPARKSFEAMFHAVREDASQLKLVYRQLSDYSHFASLAVWNAHSIDDAEQGMTSWTDVPRWRDERHFQIACAQAHELASASFETLDRLGTLLVSAGPRGRTRSDISSS